MPVSCIFALNNRPSSNLSCLGFGSIEAYSGRDLGRDNPRAVALEGIGPIPPGRYYIIDRETGGRLGWARDLWAEYANGNDHSQWFSLWNPSTGDITIVNGVKRGNFRIHPSGISGLSKGCITIVNKADFIKLREFIRSGPPSIPIPGARQKAYGIVEVR